MGIDPSFVITHETENDWVKVELTGSITVKTVVSMATAACDVGRKNDCHYWIADCTRTQALYSNVEIFGFASRLGRVGIEPTDIIAIVVASDLEKHEFAETVSRNRGYPNLRYFRDAEKAEAWIRQRQERSD